MKPKDTVAEVRAQDERQMQEYAALMNALVQALDAFKRVHDECRHEWYAVPTVIDSQTDVSRKLLDSLSGGMEYFQGHLLDILNRHSELMMHPLARLDEDLRLIDLIAMNALRTLSRAVTDLSRPLGVLESAREGGVGVSDAEGLSRLNAAHVNLGKALRRHRGAAAQAALYLSGLADHVVKVGRLLLEAQDLPAHRLSVWRTELPEAGDTALPREFFEPGYRQAVRQSRHAVMEFSVFDQ